MLLDESILNQYAALIFDMDGTLINSMPSHAKAWEQTGRELGYSLDSQIMYELGGATTYIIAEEMMRRANVPAELLEQLVQRKRALAFEFILSESTLLPAFEIVQHYRDKKPMAVGTGSHRKLAYELLDKFDLRPYFEAIVVADDVEHHKPAPDTFLLCAERLAVNPTECLVFEDADLGVQSALAGGMDVFDVRTNQLIKAD